MANKSRTTANLVSNTGISTFTDLNITRVNITGVGTISNGSITNLTGTSSTITTLRSTTLNADTGNIVTGVTTNFNATNVVITGVTTVSAGTAALPSITPSGDSNTGIFFPAADHLNFSTGGTSRVQIESDGDINIDGGGVFYDATNNRLGIGTSSPGYKLEVSVATNDPTTGSPAAGSFLQVAGGTTTIGNGPSIVLANTTGAKETFWRMSAVTVSGNNGDLVFNGYNGGVTYPERLRITAAGNVGIGDGGPDSTLTIKAAASTTPLRVSGPSSEFLRCDQSGRLLVGTTQAPGIGELLCIEKASTGTEGAGIRFGGTYSIADTATQSFNCGNGTLVFISENTLGDGALFFCCYKSANVTLLSDPNNRYANSDTATKICVFKSANTSVVTLKNNTGATRSFTIGKVNNSD